MGISLSFSGLPRKQGKQGRAQIDSYQGIAFRHAVQRLTLSMAPMRRNNKQRESFVQLRPMGALIDTERSRHG
jgi:hypothetical protein